MANRPRWWKADAVYSETKRTVDRQFLLRPEPGLRNLIGACLGRALEKFPVKLYWAEANINHWQMGRSPIEGQIENMSRFDQLFYSLLTRELNRERDREGPMWSSRNRSIECVDDAAAEDRLIYSMANPVQDGLCEKVKHWNKISFSAYSQLAEGKKEKFSYIDWTAWHKAGGKRSGKKPEEFTKWVTVVFEPLPHLADMPTAKREARLRRQLREVEQKERTGRQKEKRTAMTQTRLEKTDPRGRPKTRRVRTPMPLCHASSAGARIDFKERWYDHLASFVSASGQYREGKFETEFPDGSFRPPLTTVCCSHMRC